jgi:tRNA (guanine-N7-)-methyltransferase
LPCSPVFAGYDLSYNADLFRRLIQMLQSRQFTALASAIEIIPANYFEPLDLETIYGRKAPLEVDLGCGDGALIAELAAANSERNFLGIERLLGRVRQTSGRIVRRELTNARVLRIETAYAVQHMLPVESVARFHLMFPDPWPKRRHWHRRVVTSDFLLSIHRALAPQGLFRIATDQIDYFREIERVAARSAQFIAIAHDRAPGAVSTFEKRFRESKMEIHCLLLRKVSEVA